MFRNYFVKTCQSAGLWATGDCIAQYVGHYVACQKDQKESRSSPPFLWNPHPTLRAMLFASCCFTPMATAWYAFLFKLIPMGGARASLGKVAMDQLLFAPVVICSYFSAMTFLEMFLPVKDGAKPNAEVKRLTDANLKECQTVITGKLRSTFFETLQTNWCLWVPAQLVNFFIVAPQHTVLVVNAIGIPWASYCAWKNAQISK